MASYFGRQQSVASMASLPADEVEFELDLEVKCICFFIVLQNLSSPPKDQKVLYSSLSRFLS